MALCNLHHRQKLMQIQRAALYMQPTPHRSDPQASIGIIPLLHHAPNSPRAASTTQYSRPLAHNIADLTEHSPLATLSNCFHTGSFNFHSQPLHSSISLWPSNNCPACKSHIVPHTPQSHREAHGLIHNRIPFTSHTSPCDQCVTLHGRCCVPWGCLRVRPGVAAPICQAAAGAAAVLGLAAGAVQGLAAARAAAHGCIARVSAGAGGIWWVRWMGREGSRGGGSSAQQQQQQWPWLQGWRAGGVQNAAAAAAAAAARQNTAAAGGGGGGGAGGGGGEAAVC
eukprot:1158883-Pelagomonas_calceolata.AAC.22